jgi:small conductance mechanosensitive channel
MNSVSQWLSKNGLSILFVLLGAAIAYFVGSKILDLFIRQIVKGKNRNQPKKDIEKRQNTLAALVVAIWRILVIIIGAISIFQKLFPDVNLSPLFASAGILGVAFAFGAQAIIKDFLGGIFIVSENQYRVGDIVDINGAAGTVEKLGTRTTVIRDLDGNVHYIPNGTISHVINKTMGYSKVNFSISIDSNTDVDQVIDSINKVGQKLYEEEKWHRKIIEAPKFGRIESFDAQAIKLNITGKVQPSDQWSVAAEMRKRLIVEFNKENINVA